MKWVIYWDTGNIAYGFKKYIRSGRTFSYLRIKDILIFKHKFSFIILASFSQRALLGPLNGFHIFITRRALGVESLVKCFKLGTEVGRGQLSSLCHVAS